MCADGTDLCNGRPGSSCNEPLDVPPQLHRSLAVLTMVAVEDAVHSIRAGACTVQVKPIWIPCLVVALLLVALIVRYRRGAHLYVLEQKRRQERLDAHRFLQEVAPVLCARM